LILCDCRISADKKKEARFKEKARIKGIAVPSEQPPKVLSQPIDAHMNLSMVLPVPTMSFAQARINHYRGKFVDY
jgi:hypothetical protein